MSTKNSDAEEKMLYERGLPEAADPWKIGILTADVTVTTIKSVVL